VTMATARPEAGAKEAMQAGARLIDVRTAQEYAEGHLKGAINIPVDALAARMSELGSKTDAVVIYCRSGKRSARAKQLVLDAGFNSVHDLGAMSNGEP